MLSEEELRRDLSRLREIAAGHKAQGKELAVHSETINGQSVDVFSNIPANLGQFYRLGLQKAELDFLVFQDQRYSFAESLDWALRLGRALLSDYQIRPGDRVAICARNSPEWCLAYMATTLIGAVVVPMNAWWQGPELEYGLKDSGARVVFADSERCRRLGPYLQGRDASLIAINPDGEVEAGPEFFSLLQSIAPLTEREVEALDIKPDDNASIMYTSGSTGEPKGVLSTHRAILSALYTWKFVREINEILRPELVEENPEFEPAMLCNVPLFHVTGCHAQFLTSFVYQRKFVMMYKWDPERALELIEKERISVFHGVPTMTWELMHAEGFARADLRSLRSVQSGGAPRPPEHLELIVRKFPRKALPGLGYGLTETNAIGAIVTGEFYTSRPQSTGRPSPPVTQVKIVNEAGEELGADEVGEICIKGPTLMKEYWNKPEATAEVLRDGWFHSGDLGMLDKTGFLIIVDRAKDIVIRGGENIGCAEVEYSISEHPAVAEVSVYGIPDSRLGEIPAATITLKPGQDLDKQALQTFLAERIAGFKIPTVVSFQQEKLPRLATGKIAKKILRQRTIAGSA